MGSTALVILLILAAVHETVETNSTSVSVSVSETTSASNLVSTSVSAPTKKTLDYKTTVIPVVDGGGNETSWRAECNDMKSFMERDDQCKAHQHEMPWTLEEEMGIDIAFILGSSLSACGSGFIILTFILMPRVRDFSFQIVFCLCVCDFLSSTAGLWGLHFDHSNPMYPTPRCYVSAIFWQFFDIGTFCWVCIIAINVWLSVGKRKNTKHLFLWYNVAAWGISTVLTVLPALIHSGGFGPSFGYAGGGNWCWLRDSEWLTRVLFFYIWLFVAIITVCIFFGLSSRAMKESEMDQDIIKAFIRKLTLYVVIFSFVRVLGLVDTVARAINACCPIFPLTVVMSFVAPMLGVANAAIFGFSKKVRAAYREKCCNHQRKASYKVDVPPSPGDKPRTVVTPEKKAVTKDDAAPDGAA